MAKGATDDFSKSDFSIVGAATADLSVIEQMGNREAEKARGTTTYFKTFGENRKEGRQHLERNA